MTICLKISKRPKWPEHFSILNFVYGSHYPSSPSLETRVASDMRHRDWVSEAKLVRAEFSLHLFTHSLIFRLPTRLTNERIHSDSSQLTVF